MGGALAALALTLVLAFPAAAPAGEVSRDGQTIRYAGDAKDERFVVDVLEGEYGFDADFTIFVGAGCSDSGSGDPKCGATADRLVFELAEGSDRARLAPALDADPWPVPTEMRGGSGDDDLTGGVLDDLLYGDDGNDDLSPRAGGGLVDGGPGDDTFTSIGGAVQVIGGLGVDDVQFDGPDDRMVTLDGAPGDPSGSNLGPDIENVTTGAGNDTVVGSDGHNTIVTAAGNDLIAGGPGSDTILAGEGDDRIESEDGWLDPQIDCGDGTDTVVVDAADVVEADCEIVFREGQDRDDDDVSPPADCDDDNRFIHPGAADVPRNGIDEDCSGTDADADRDGFLAPQDCNDANPAIRPGATDRRGNGIDEDCSGRDRGLLANRAAIAARWQALRRHTTVRLLRVNRVPARGRVQVRCRGRGCPFARRNLRVRRSRASATALLRRARLRRGAVIEVRVTAPETMGRVFRYTTRRARRPSARRLCLPPGARSPGRCP